MKVTNKTTFTLIAFGCYTLRGYGDDVEIPPGQTIDVNGPLLGEMGGGICHIILPGEITCHEAPDSDLGFQVARGSSLSVGCGDKSITIRHYLDMPEEYVLQWREQNNAG